MDIKIHGNKNVKGVVNISGSKNSCLAILCASALTKGKVELFNVPKISDIYDMASILKYVNCKVKFKRNKLIIDSSNITYKPLILELCQRFRASYYFIGVFLTLFNKCEISLPGGCNIGKRPIDFHIDGFTKMGFKCEIKENVLCVTKDTKNTSYDVTLTNKSVGTTINILLGSLSFKQGFIRNSLVEPECEDLIIFLNKIGYNILLNKDVIITNTGNTVLKSIKHSIIPDRIETMTYTVLGLLCGKILVKNCNPKHLLIPLNILLDAGYDIKIQNDCLHVNKSVGNQINIKTDVYPGFPTDLQPIFGVLISQTKIGGTVEETIFENRLQIYKDLISIGVLCQIENNLVNINPGEVNSFVLKAVDLRQGAALIILALLGKDESTINNFEYVLRGYDKLFKKLKKIGVRIYKKR